MLLLIYIYAILGVSLFATVKIDEPLNDLVNFHNFFNVFIILFRSSSGENWNNIMKAIMRKNSILFQCEESFDYETYKANNFVTNTCGSPAPAVIYFISYIILVILIFLNLFKAIVLNQYFDIWEELNQHFGMNTMQKYIDTWKKYDPDATGFINKEKLKDLLWDLGFPLGWGSDEYKDKEIQEATIQSYRLTLFNDIQDYQFYDLLESLSKKMILNYSLEEMLREHDLKQEERQKNNAAYQIKDFNFEEKFQTCEKELRDIEQNQFNIQAVKNIVKLKARFKGNGMFEYLTFQEQERLKKWITSCKEAMLMRRELKEQK